MENMPYQDTLETMQVIPHTTPEVVSSDWRERLPVLSGKQVVLRELRTSDAASLFTMLTTEEVARFIPRRRRRLKDSSGSSTGPSGSAPPAPTRASP